MTIDLEVCATSRDSAIAAQAAGATRIELCSLLEVGGITPSYGLIATVREAVQIPIHVLIRPRTGGFVYTEGELSIIERDIDAVGELKCEGVVIGCLTAEGRVDTIRTQALVRRARRWGITVTFHRAFDDLVDQLEGLEDVVSTGCDRILTSGGRQSVADPAAKARMKALVDQAAGRIKVMPGAGINVDNVASIVEETDVDEVHASCKRTVAMGEQEKSLFANERWETDEGTVRDMVRRLEDTDT